MFQLKFIINLEPVLQEQAHLKLFNGYNEMLHSGYGEMDLMLDKGIYILWIEFKEHVEERIYRIDKDTVDYLNTVTAISSIPLQGLASTHEYFSNPATVWSRNITNTQKEQIGGHLFFFLRYESPTVPFDQSLAVLGDFILLNDKRKPVIRFNEENSKIESGQVAGYFGTISFHTSLKNGQYFLVYKDGTRNREIPLYVYTDYQTQLFLNFDNAPIFGSLKISISKLGFDGNDPQIQLLDTLILKIFNGILSFPKDLIPIAKKGKWDNIMLAFVALYNYLSSDKEKELSFYETYMKQLESLLPKDTESSEFRALRLLAAVVFQQKKPSKTLLFPTMIQRGMQVFLEQSYENARLIKAESMVQQILVNMKEDTIFTTYEPLSIDRSPKKTRATSKSKSRNPQSGNRIGSLSLPKEDLHAIARDIVAKIPVQDTKWITETILHDLANPRNENLAIKKMAMQLQVTQHSIKQSLTFLKDKDALETMKQSEKGFDEMDISTVLKRIKKLK